MTAEDRILEELAKDSNRSISKALKKLYTKRKVVFPVYNHIMMMPISVLDLSTRPMNGLYIANIKTIGDIIELHDRNKRLTDLRRLGETSAIEIFEKMLDYIFLNLTTHDKALLISNFVQDNEKYLR